MSRLVEQSEAERPDEAGRYFGAELFYDAAEGYYTARFHCRIYNGVKVDSSYATDEIRLEAHDRTGARAEARRHYDAFVGLYKGEPA